MSKQESRQTRHPRHSKAGDQGTQRLDRLELAKQAFLYNSGYLDQCRISSCSHAALTVARSRRSWTILANATMSADYCNAEVR